MTENRKPLVSVVMPVYNTEKYVGEAIESILAQTFTDFELIIVDDGSQDGSAEIMRAYAAGDSRIRMIQIAENAGEGAARGAALNAAVGAYVTGLDSDDISLPDRLQKQTDFLRTKPRIGAVGVHAHVVSEDLQQLYDREPPERHAEIVLSFFVGALSDPFVHASVMARRGLLLEAGGYDESLRNSPDADLMTRLLGQTIFANIAEPLYVYRRHAVQLSAHDEPLSNNIRLLVRQRRLERIWGEAPLETVDRLARVRRWSKLTWRERRLAKRDILRLIDAFIAAEWVDPHDRPQLIGAMNRRLERVSPRLWQKFCHWRRHNFGEISSRKRSKNVTFTPPPPEYMFYSFGVSRDAGLQH